MKAKNRAHDIYLKSPTGANHDTFRELIREVMENEWLLKYSDEMLGHFDRGDKNNFYGSVNVVFGPSDKSLAPVRREIV